MKKIAETVAQKWGVPTEVLMDLPRIQIAGNREMFVENYKKILVYTPAQITLDCKNSPVSIFGEKMCIAEITSDRIFIQGVIEKVVF